MPPQGLFKQITSITTTYRLQSFNASTKPNVFKVMRKESLTELLLHSAAAVSRILHADDSIKQDGESTTPYT